MPLLCVDRLSKVETPSPGLTETGERSEWVSIQRPNYRRKYSFLIYNSSLCLYNIIRDYFRESYLQHFLETVKLIKELLQENMASEYDWLGRFTWLLFNCSIDGSDQEQSTRILKELWGNSSRRKYALKS